MNTAPLTRAQAQFELFVSTAYDVVAQHDGHTVTWDRARKATRQEWRDAFAFAIGQVTRSRVSDLGHLLANPPDPLQTFSYALHLALDGNLRHRRSEDGARLAVLWPTAIARGMRALQVTRGEQPDASSDRLLQHIPMLRIGGAHLHPDEAPY